MLRCKLRCTRSNGRVAENSHYHCCLCGRVCLRKVHLFCHLQAHSLGAQHEIDEEMMDADKDEEEIDDAVEDEDELGDSSALESPQIQALTSSQSENVVALTDGTQVRTDCFHIYRFILLYCEQRSKTDQMSAVAVILKL